MVKFFKNRLIQILLLAGVLRFFMVGTAPISLNWDEVSQGYTAYSIMQTGADEWGVKLPLFFRSYGEWKSAVYIYILVPFIKVLGLNAVSIRLPSAIASLVSVYLIYLIVVRLWSKPVALWAAFLMAVTPWSFMLGRAAFEADVALMLVLGGIYFALDNRFFLSALALGLAPHTYNSAKFVVPFLAIYLFFAKKLYQNLKSSVLFFAVLAVFAYPIITGLFTGTSLARYSQVGITTDQKLVTSFYELRKTLPLPPILQKLIINKPTYVVYHLISNSLDYLSPGFLAWHAGDRPQHSLPYHGVLYVSEFVAVILGLFVLLKNSGALRMLPFVLIFLGIIPAALTKESEHVLRSLLAIPGFIMLASLGFDSLQDYKNKKIVNFFNWLLILEVLGFMLIYFTWYPKAYARDWQYGYSQVAAYLNTHENEYDRIVMTKWYGEPQLFLAFYNRWDPKTYQLNNANNLRYETESAVWLDQLEEYTVGKYHFKYLEWGGEERGRKTLYIGKGDDFDDEANILETIYFPDGTVAFKLVAGDK